MGPESLVTTDRMSPRPGRTRRVQLGLLGMLAVFGAAWAGNLAGSNLGFLAGLFCATFGVVVAAYLAGPHRGPARAAAAFLGTALLAYEAFGHAHYRGDGWLIGMMLDNPLCATWLGGMCGLGVVLAYWISVEHTRPIALRCTSA